VVRVYECSGYDIIMGLSKFVCLLFCFLEFVKCVVSIKKERMYGMNGVEWDRGGIGWEGIGWNGMEVR